MRGKRQRHSYTSDTLDLPNLGMDKGVEPPAPHVISYPKREARAPTDYATSKISVGMVPSILVAVGQGQDHSPDTKRTAEPLHH